MVISDIPKWPWIKNTDDLNYLYNGLKWPLSSDTVLRLKTTVLIHQNDRSVIPDNRGKFGFENVHAVDIDQSERFLE